MDNWETPAKTWKDKIFIVVGVIVYVFLFLNGLLIFKDKVKK